MVAARHSGAAVGSPVVLSAVTRASLAVPSPGPSLSQAPRPPTPQRGSSQPSCWCFLGSVSAQLSSIVGLAPLTPTHNGLALSFLGKYPQPSPGLAVPRPLQTVPVPVPGRQATQAALPQARCSSPPSLCRPQVQPDEGLSTRQARRHTVDGEGRDGPASQPTAPC